MNFLQFSQLKYREFKFEVLAFSQFLQFAISELLENSSLISYDLFIAITSVATV